MAPVKRKSNVADLKPSLSTDAVIPAVIFQHFLFVVNNPNIYFNKAGECSDACLS